MATAEQPQTIHRVKAEQVTNESFAPFGEVISKEGRERLPINLYGDRSNVFYPVAFESDQPVEYLLTNCRLREFRVLFMERHVELTQTFVPLSGNPFLIVVARPDAREEEGMPALDEIKAFIVPGYAAINIHRGTWHEFPFPLVDDMDIIISSHQSLTEGLKQKLDERKEINKLDVEKRNFTERTDLVLRVELP